MAKQVGKPEAYVMVSLQTDKPMWWVLPCDCVLITVGVRAWSCRTGAKTTIPLALLPPPPPPLANLLTLCPCSYGGSEEPCAYAEIVSIGGFRGKNADISAAVMSLVEKELGVSPARFYINFVGVEGANFGWKGATF